MLFALCTCVWEVSRDGRWETQSVHSGGCSYSFVPLPLCFKSPLVPVLSPHYTMHLGYSTMVMLGSPLAPGTRWVPGC